MSGTDLNIIVDDDLDLKVNSPNVEWAALPVFYRKEFFDLHIGDHQGFHFLLINKKNKRPLGAGHFIKADAGVFKSPFRGSFGGMFFDPEITLEKIDRIYSIIESFLKEQGAKQIAITLPPFAYSAPLNSVTYNSLVRAGYQVSNHELNYAMTINSVPLIERVEYGNRKRINKCIREGINVRALEKERFQDAYNVIVENRTKKGFPITLSWESLSEMVEKMPEVVRCFGAFQGEELIASSVCMALSPSVLYVFYWGERPGTEQLSPVSIIADSLYKYCQDQKIGLLDIGTSTVQGVPNHGLIRFKKSLSCDESLKLSFSKAIE